MPDHPDDHDPLDPGRATALLERAAASVTASPRLEDRVDSGLAHARRRRRHRALAAAAALLVVAGLAAVVVDHDDGRDRGPVIAGPTADDASPPATPGTDAAIPAAPSPDELATARWADVAPPPIDDGRSDAAWAASDRYLLVWGGSADRHDGLVFGDGAVLDVQTGRWERVGPFPGIAARAGAGAAIDGDTAWIVGGRLSPSVVHGAAQSVDAGDLSSEVIRIDLVTGSAEVVATSDRAARIHPRVGVADGRIMVAGGQRAHDDQERSISALDPATGTWTDGDILPWATESGRYYWPADGPSAVAGDDLVLARARISGVPGAVEVAEVDLTTLRSTTREIVRIAPADVDHVVAETLPVPTPSGLVLVSEVGEVVATGVDPTTGDVRWNQDVPIVACEGPIDAAATSRTVVVRSDCGGIVAIDAASGGQVDLPEPPEGGWSKGGRLIAVGDVVLHLQLGHPGDGPNQVSPITATVVALAVG